MRRATPLLGGAVVAALALAGCGGGGDDATGPTLPASLSPGTTLLAPGHGTTDTADGHDATSGAVSPDGPAASGAPVIESLRAEPGAACVAGTTPLTVSFTVRPDPPVRVVTVVLDGSTAGSTTDQADVVVPALPCDGQVHTVLVVATGLDTLSGTASVAIRAPGG